MNCPPPPSDAKPIEWAIEAEGDHVSIHWELARWYKIESARASQLDACAVVSSAIVYELTAGAKATQIETAHNAERLVASQLDVSNERARGTAWKAAATVGVPVALLTGIYLGARVAR